MNYVVCDQVVLSKAPEGPLAAYIRPGGIHLTPVIPTGSVDGNGKFSANTG